MMSGWPDRWWLAGLLAITVLCPRARGAEGQAVSRFRDEIQPILSDYCYGCHGDGMKKGGVAFDGFASDEALVGDQKLWSAVLKNVRAGIMPPAKKPRPSGDELKLLEDWIKRGAFGIDPADPDPGRVTIRRLNRVEYRNTIRDLMGIDFRVEDEFPPDDTGYGFDTIADVLTVSPLLLEKYLQAAEAIVREAVPTVSKVVQSTTIPGTRFRGGAGVSADRMSFYKPATVSRSFKAEKEGTYRVAVELAVLGAFDFDPGRCTLVFKAGDRELLREDFKWESGKKHRYEFTEKWPAGDRPLSFEILPLTPPEEKKSSVDMRVTSVVVEGPLEPEHWARPKNYDRFFFEDDPGTTPERRRYAREVLRRFVRNAFRRPCDERYLDRLLAIAEGVFEQPGKSVESGIAEAMVPVLASPRFLFRVEEPDPNEGAKAYPLLDEYALASRLSYFLWSTMPDAELFALAERGELRKNLAAQVKRMVDEPRSEMLVQNFTGQWLQARDVEGIAIDAREVLARDSGEEKLLAREREEFRVLLAQREAERKKQAQDQPKTQRDARFQIRSRFKLLFGEPKAQLDAPLRTAMRRETEMFFAGIVREDRSVLDLLDSDYTYLNERLARHYDIPGVTGEEMRRVSLPPGSPRGGLLTQGTVLVVTSNPTRTSPVKRGLFVLDNFLGTPPPPPPPDVPQLEEAEKGVKDREPSLREVLELHRSKALCNSCHSRMDPLGLALDNFNAMGMWRDKERNQPLDTAGELITGEPFAGVGDLKRILKGQRRGDFYRCLTEKLLTYALGRGLGYSDDEAVDRIVDRLEREQGRFSALLMGIIESAPFQKRRNGSVVAATAAGRPGPTDSPETAPLP
jgi:hypothetical protein